MKIGERLKKIREKLNLNQKEFAKKLGTSSTTITMIENGQRDPSRQLLIKLAEVYKIDITWILTGMGKVFIDNIKVNLMFDEAITLLKDFTELNDKSKKEILKENMK